MPSFDVVLNNPSPFDLLDSAWHKPSTRHKINRIDPTRNNIRYDYKQDINYHLIIYSMSLLMDIYSSKKTNNPIGPKFISERHNYIDRKRRAEMIEVELEIIVWIDGWIFFEKDIDVFINDFRNVLINPM